MNNYNNFYLKEDKKLKCLNEESKNPNFLYAIQLIQGKDNDSFMAIFGKEKTLK